MMKKSGYLLSVISVFLLCCTACVKTTTEEKLPSPETVPICVVSTASGLSSEARWYKDNSFKFNYDELPVITINNSDTLYFSVNWDTDVLTVSEDYYESPSEHTGICYKETYELQKNDEGLFALEIKRRNNIREEQAIYYIVNDAGKFVIKVLLPVTENIT